MTPRIALSTVAAPFAAGLVVMAILIGVVTGVWSRVRGQQCEGAVVNGLACVECHAPGRTVITCGVSP